MRRFSQRGGTLRAVVLGPLFLDVIFSSLARLPQPGQELWCEDCAFVAGGAANQARALSRMGFDVGLRSYLGQDLPGAMVETLLNNDGISTALLEPTPRQSVTAALSIETDRAMVSSGTNEAPPLAGPAPDLLMCDLRALRRNRDTVSRWRAEGTYVVGDVGWDDSSLWDPEDLNPLHLVDLFVPNEEEARNYTRTDSAESAAGKLAKLVPAVVVTRGAEGTAVAGDLRDLAGDTSFSLPAYPARAIDPTGAGDVFSAVLAWGVLQEAGLRQSVSVASLAGALSTERLGGAGAPSLDELCERARNASADSSPVPAGFDLSLLTQIS